MTSAFEHFEQGRLFDAVQAAIDAVRTDPTNVQDRYTLISYLCFEGDLDRAEKHIQIVIEQAPDLAGEMLVYRNLLRGEIARRQCFGEGRIPRFTDEPPEHLRNVLKALTHLADDPAAAAEILQPVLAHQAEIRGSCNGEEFVGFRDCNDLTPSFFEAITMAGEYYWIPFEDLHEIEFDDFHEPRDVIWRPAQMTTKDHKSVSTYVPGLYHDTFCSNDDALRLGRAADWMVEDDCPSRGIGGRTFLVQGTPRPMALIEYLTFS